MLDSADNAQRIFYCVPCKAAHPLRPFGCC